MYSKIPFPLSSPHPNCNALPFVINQVTICVGLFLESVFFISLFAYPYVHTTLSFLLVICETDIIRPFVY